jgi:hypothetical protein
MEKRIRSSGLKRWFLLAGLIGVAVAIYAIPWIFWQLQIPVKTRCSDAQEEFSGDCVEALVAVIQSVHHSYLAKNRAIWALGQLADERALPALCDLQSGVPCRRPCHRDLHVCQYEIERAIKWSEKGTLFVRWMRTSTLKADSK